MATGKQIEANRRNARKSTGPTSPEGKAVVARNALKSGIYANSVLICGEDKANFDALIADYYREYQPATLEARSLVDELVLCEWYLRRFPAIDAQVYNRYTGVPSSPNPLALPAARYSQVFIVIQRRIDATRRARDRAHEMLRQLAARSAPAIVPDPTAPSPDSPGAPAAPLTPSAPTPSPENWACSVTSPTTPARTPSEPPAGTPTPSSVSC